MHLLTCALALTVAAIGMSAPAGAVPIVSNGGFETGDFTGWTLSGNNSFSGVECPGPGFVPDESCDAFFGPVGSTGTISQVLSTIAGQTYTISFWLNTDGGAPSSFVAAFDGYSLLTLTNPADTPYTFYTFTMNASTTSTLLSFTFRDDPGFMNLDVVKVVEGSVPEPGTWALMLVGFGAMGFALRRSRKPGNALVRLT